MNLVEVENELKNLSDQQLLAQSKNPGTAPGYAVLAEMTRRKSVRDSYQAQQARFASQQPQPTVNQQAQQQLRLPEGVTPPAPQQMVQQHGQATPAGLGSLPPQAPQQAASGGLMGLPQRFAGGGAIHRDAGGEMDDGYGGSQSEGGDDPQGLAGLQPQQAQADFSGLANIAFDPEEVQSAPKSMPTAAQVRSLADYIKEEKEASGATNWDTYRKKLDQMIADQQKQRVRPGDLLLRAGLAMAGSGAKSLPEAIGRGGLAALDYQDHQKASQQATIQKLQMEQFQLGRYQDLEQSAAARAAIAARRGDLSEAGRMQGIQAASDRMVEQLKAKQAAQTAQISGMGDRLDKTLKQRQDEFEAKMQKAKDDAAAKAGQAGVKANQAQQRINISANRAKGAGVLGQPIVPPLPVILRQDSVGKIFLNTNGKKIRVKAVSPDGTQMQSEEVK